MLIVWHAAYYILCIIFPQAAISDCTTQILPLENANGRKLVESGQLCERKNGRGVDPNRNWDAHWGFKESDYDPAEEYPGAAPFRLVICPVYL